MFYCCNLSIKGNQKAEMNSLALVEAQDKVVRSLCIVFLVMLMNNACTLTSLRSLGRVSFRVGGNGGKLSWD